LSGVWARGVSKKIWNPLCIFSTVEAINFKFGTQLGFGTSLPKNNVLDQNWRGCGPEEHPKKLGTPYVYLQPLKLATSNLVHKLRLGLAYQKRRLGPKLAGVWARRAHKNIWDPPRISATVKASNFKLGTRIWFGTSLPKKMFRTKIGEGCIQKSWDPYLFLQPLKLATSNLVYNLDLGLSYQKTTFRTKIGGGLGQGSI